MLWPCWADVLSRMHPTSCLMSSSCEGFRSCSRISAWEWFIVKCKEVLRCAWLQNQWCEASCRVIVWNDRLIVITYGYQSDLQAGKSESIYCTFLYQTWKVFRSNPINKQINKIYCLPAKLRCKCQLSVGCNLFSCQIKKETSWQTRKKIIAVILESIAYYPFYCIIYQRWSLNHKQLDRLKDVNTNKTGG